MVRLGLGRGLNRIGTSAALMVTVGTLLVSGCASTNSSGSSGSAGPTAVAAGGQRQTSTASEVCGELKNVIQETIAKGPDSLKRAVGQNWTVNSRVMGVNPKNQGNIKVLMCDLKFDPSKIDYLGFQIMQGEKSGIESACGNQVNAIDTAKTGRLSSELSATVGERLYSCSSGIARTPGVIVPESRSWAAGMVDYIQDRRGVSDLKSNDVFFGWLNRVDLTSQIKE